MRIILKRTLGVVAFSMGLILSGWFIYNQIWPTDEFKSGFRSIFQLVLPIAFLLVGWNWIRYKGRGIEEVITPDIHCAELDRSRELAQTTLADFISEVEKGIDGAFIKFPLKTPSDMTEHIWGYVHFHRDGRFNVSLANDPVDKKQESEGRHDVPAQEVEDWQIVSPTGTIRGAYSLIAMFQCWEGQGKRLSPRMKEQKATLESIKRL